MSITVDFKTFLNTIPYIVGGEKAYPVLMRGPHGIGKSELVYQIAERAHEFGLKVIRIDDAGDATLIDEKGVALPVEDFDIELKKSLVERRASQMQEGDLIGLPILDQEKDTTRWNPPDWFKVACNHPVIIFLDEIDRADIAVRQGIFELTDSRKLNGYHLHEGTRIFAAVNSGVHEQAKHYLVGEMDPAEQDRWWVIDLEPTQRDWLDWARGKVVPEIWDFIREKSNDEINLLDHTGEFIPHEVTQSRRSWVRLSNCLKKHLDWNAGEQLKDMDSGILMTVCHGFIGGISSQFVEYVVNYEYRVSVEDILNDGRFDLIADWDINQHDVFIDTIAKSPVFDELLIDGQVANLGEYFRILAYDYSEVAARLQHFMIANIIDLASLSENEAKNANSTRFLNYKTRSGETVGELGAKVYNCSVADLEKIQKKIDAASKDIETI